MIYAVYHFTKVKVSQLVETLADGRQWPLYLTHYNDIIMEAMASQITSLAIVYWTVYSGEDQRKHQSSVSLAFVRGIPRWPMNSPHKWPVTRKVIPFDDVIMIVTLLWLNGLATQGAKHQQLWYLIGLIRPWYPGLSTRKVKCFLVFMSYGNNEFNAWGHQDNLEKW